jgi:hypothetical protein
MFSFSFPSPPKLNQLNSTSAWLELYPTQLYAADWWISIVDLWCSPPLTSSSFPPAGPAPPPPHPPPPPPPPPAPPSGGSPALRRTWPSSSLRSLLAACGGRRMRDQEERRYCLGRGKPDSVSVIRYPSLHSTTLKYCVLFDIGPDSNYYIHVTAYILHRGQ